MWELGGSFRDISVPSYLRKFGLEYHAEKLDLSWNQTSQEEQKAICCRSWKITLTEIVSRVK